MRKPNHRRRRSRSLMGVTKKDFQSIAAILCRNGASSGMIDDMAGYFKSENAAFDRERFSTAARTCKR